MVICSQLEDIERKPTERVWSPWLSFTALTVQADAAILGSAVPGLQTAAQSMVKSLTPKPEATARERHCGAVVMAIRQETDMVISSPMTA